MYSLYSYKKKRPTGMIITLILVTVIAGTSGYFVYKKLKEPIVFENNSVQEDITKSTAGEINDEKKVKYNENTDFNLTVFYSCGHKLNSVSKIPPSFYNKTIDEIKKDNPEYDIYGYTDYLISANEMLNEQCDNHYMLILNGNKLTGYNKKTPDVVEKEATVNLREFLKEDIEILKNGIELTSKTELLEYFESFSS